MIKRFLYPAVLCLAIALVHLGGALEFLERRWMDVRFQLTSRPSSSRVVLVDIDPRSLAGLPVWPWPRGYHASVLEQLREAGARRIGFDIDFSSRSVAEEDAEFARALERAARRVVLPVFQQWQQAGPGVAALAAVEPLPELRQHVSLGTINVRPGPDGLVRRYLNRGEVAAQPVPGFATALAGDPRPQPDSFYIDFGIQTATIPRISYIDVLTGQFDPAQVQGKTIIVGSSAVELGDQIAVPVAAALPGPHLQALAYESLVQGRVLRRLGSVPTLAVAVLIVLLLGPAFAALSWRGGLVLGLGLSVGTLLASILVQRRMPVILDVSPWLLAFATIYGRALVARIDQQALGLLAQRLRIRRTESLMQHVVENSFDAILTLRADGKLETFNRSATQMFSYRDGEAVGRPLDQLIDLGPFTEVGLEGLGGTPFEASGRRRDGSAFPLEMVVKRIHLDDELKLVAFLRDITETKAHQAALEHQATHDALTGLPNRHLLLDHLKRALERGSRESGGVAVLLLDLDRFKEINDALGHHTGDRLLQQVAQRLQTPLRSADTIAHLGGDEFAVLLLDTGQESARRVAAELLEALTNPFNVDGMQLQVETSIGIALFPEHASDAQTLLQRADVAMYVAKRKRADLAVYLPEYDYNSVRNLTLKADLRFAIEDGLLELVYQPKLSAATDQLIGAEALLRWNHPRHGNIRPDEFIGLAEHSGLIRPLTMLVIERAVQQGAEWAHAGHPCVISVNLSPRNLLDEELPASIERSLRAHRLPPDRLIFEITESVLMEDPARSLEVITQLRCLGLDISIDDFGAGYSSLSYLMRLPAREIKIDKSFVMRMDQDPGSATIVRSIIELAHNLNLKVVAEGVETRETWMALKRLRCDIGQGYYLGRPMPAGELLRRGLAGTAARPDLPLLLPAGPASVPAAPVGE